MEALLEIIEETPWWVWAVLTAILAFGFKASERRTLPLKQIFILPIVLLAWSIGSVYERWHGHTSDIAFWTLSFGLGNWVGWFVVKTKKVLIDRERQTLTLTGSWWVLTLGLLFFSIRYAFGFYYATHSAIPHMLFITDLIFSGFLSGMLVGRALRLWRHYETFK